MEENKRDKLVIWGMFAALCVASIGLAVVEFKIKNRMQYKMVEKAVYKALSDNTLRIQLFAEGTEVPLNVIKHF